MNRLLHSSCLLLLTAGFWLPATPVPGLAAAETDPAPAKAPAEAPDASAQAPPVEEPSEEPPADQPADASADGAERPPDDAADEPSGEAAVAAPELPKGQKMMRLEDIKDLPPLRRYDLPLEKGEQFLADVEDNTFGYDESAFWWIVHLVSQLPDEAFKPGDVTNGFSQLIAMPSSYRGKPVTIKGAYMSCAPFETPVLAIRKDVPTLYEVNIRELPLVQERPVATVIVIDNPMDYLHKTDMVTVRGYFYKVRRYRNLEGGEGFAPMLISKRLVRTEATAASGPSSTVDLSGSNILLVFAIAAILALGVVYVFLRYKTKATPHAASSGLRHRFNLRRPDRDKPAGRGGPPGDDGGPQP